MSYLGGLAGGATAAAGTIAGTFSPAPSAGSLLVIACTFDGGALDEHLIASVADSAGGVWGVTVGAWDTTNQQAIQMAYCLNAPGGATTVTATFDTSLTFRGIVGVEHSGVIASGALDKTANGIGASATPASNNTPTLTQADELIISAIMDTNSAQTPAAGSGFTRRQVSPGALLGLAIEDKIVAATSPVSGTWVFSPSSRYAVAVATFKLPSVGGGPGFVLEQDGFLLLEDGTRLRLE